MASRCVCFENFKYLGEATLRMIHEWRNREEIRQCMTNSGAFSVEEHLAFCHGLKSRNDCAYFLVSIDENPCGVVDYIDIDYQSKSAESGSYFIGKFQHDSSLIAVLSTKIPLQLGITEIRTKVKNDNLKAILFNIMKVHGEIVKEDREFSYFRFDLNKWLDVLKAEYSKHRIIIKN